MSAARDELFSALVLNHWTKEQATEFIDTYREEVQREDAATVRAQAPKYLDNEVDQAIFWALDGAAGLIDPDKGAGT